MSREIESEFTLEWGNEKTQCCKCDSFRVEGEKYICADGNFEVPPNAHCDFFKSID